MILRSVVLAALAATLAVPAVSAAGGPPEHARGRGPKAAQAEVQAQAQHGNAAGEDECVRVKRAGKSGKFQVRGNGVHLVLEVEDREEFLAELEDMDAEAQQRELNALAGAIADKVCGEDTAAAALAEAAKLTNLDFEGVDLEIAHQNTYGEGKAQD